MTVSATTPIIRYPYTGPGDYTFPFRIFKETDLTVTRIDTAGLSTVLVLGVDYTVTFDPEIIGGEVKCTLAETTGTLDIRRDMPIIQETDWVNNDPFNAELLEDDLDRTIMIIQQLEVLAVEGAAVTNWRGNWATEINYVTQDLIIAPNTNIYTCIISHLSDDFDTDLKTGYWSLVVDVETVEAARLDAEESAAEAKESETNAKLSENAADASATNAEQSAATAANSQAGAANSEINSANCSADAAESAVSADADSTEAEHWAQLNEDVPVPESTNPPEYSSYHWSKKAEGAAGGGITNLTGLAPITIDHYSPVAKGIGIDDDSDNLIPKGGSAGQLLSKVDGADRNIDWADPTSLSGYLKADGTVPMDGGYDPANDQDVATKKYIDDKPSTLILPTGCVLTGDVLGLNHRVNSTNPTTHIDIDVGTCRDRNNIEPIALNTIFVKNLNAIFTEGVGNGGNMVTPASVASTTYYIFLMKKANGVVDIGFDTDLDAANRPVDFIYYRFIGLISTKTDADIIDYEHLGDWLEFKEPVLIATIPLKTNTLVDMSTILPATRISKTKYYINATGNAASYINIFNVTYNSALGRIIYSHRSGIESMVDITYEILGLKHIVYADTISTPIVAFNGLKLMR